MCIPNVYVLQHNVYRQCICVTTQCVSPMYMCYNTMCIPNVYVLQHNVDYDPYAVKKGSRRKRKKNPRKSRAERFQDVLALLKKAGDEIRAQKIKDSNTTQPNDTPKPAAAAAVTAQPKDTPKSAVSVYDMNKIVALFNSHNLKGWQLPNPKP